MKDIRVSYWIKIIVKLLVATVLYRKKKQQQKKTKKTYGVLSALSVYSWQVMEPGPDFK